MLEPTGTRDHARALNGIARCAQCGDALLKIGPYYSCLKSAYSLERNCSLQPVNGEKLIRLVVERLIKRVINDQTTSQLVTAIQDEFRDRSQRVQENLDRTEAAIMDLNDMREQGIHPAEQGDVAMSEVIDRVEEIEQQSLGLSYEARLFRKEIDTYNFITDEGRIKDNAQDPSTYLEGTTPEDTRDLLNLFVQSVDVGNDEIVINYTNQVPRQARSDQNNVDWLPLP